MRQKKKISCFWQMIKICQLQQMRISYRKYNDNQNLTNPHNLTNYLSKQNNIVHYTLSDRLLINLQLNMVNKQIHMLLFLVVLLASISQIQAQTQFSRRNHFSLGQNVTVAKFSPDYTLLAVLRQGQNKLFSYNPMTFQLIGEAQLGAGVKPVALQMFGTDIIIAAQPNILQVYQRKINSSQLTLKQMITLKTIGGIMGMRLQKLNEDFNDKSQSSSTRHLVVWSIFSESSFQIYKYVASQDTTKVTFLYNKVYAFPSPSLKDFDFFDEKYLVFGIQESTNTGETYLLQLANTSKITKVDAKIVSSIKAFNIKPTGALSSTNYLLVTHANGASQFRAKGKSIQQGGKQVSSIVSGTAFSDNNRMIGFFNETSLYVYRDSQLFYQTYPTYTARLQQNFKEAESSITIVSMPQSNTGELIVNNCFQDGKECFYYYSLCGPNTYYTTNALGNETCKKCTADANCEKCINDACVKCNAGFYFNATKKCQVCAGAVFGCASCSQDGKVCHSCDTKQFDKDPVDNVCQCVQGTVWQPTTKKCVQCQTKIQYCAACHPLQPTTYECTECLSGLNRVPTADGKSCVCGQFYYQNPSKKCQLCDDYKKCKTCKTSNQCQQCDSAKQWILNGDGKCVCNLGYVEVNNKCLLCSILGCETCETDTVCKTCKPGFRLQENQQCVCNADRFLNQTSQQCELCSTYIDGCSECSTFKTCSHCDQKKHRSPTPTAEGKCLCANQYTENSVKECVLCTTPGCLNCESENNCTSCNDGTGFNTTVVDGKCQCKASKFLDQQNNKCNDCSSAIVGCQGCSNGSMCQVCNQTANFITTPVNGSCKCLGNFFISGSQCIQCQVICANCKKCVQIVTSDLLSTSVGCAQCQDNFQVQDSRCVQKSSNTLIYVMVSIGVLTFLIVVGVCYWMKKKARRQEQQKRKSKQSNASMVSMLLKDSANQIVTTDRTEIGSKKGYQPLFSGNINYSLSSEQRDIDKRSFNETLKDIQRERKNQYERKNRNSGYSDLGKNMRGSQKPVVTEDDQVNMKKQGLFSHRGKG